MKNPSPREQVEAQLEEAQNSINKRLSFLEDEVKLPQVPALQKVSGDQAKKIGLAVAAGILVAWGASRLFRSSGNVDEQLAEDLSEDISRMVGDGYELESAVRRAVRRNASPRPKESSSGGGILAALFMMLAKTGLNVAARGFMDRASGSKNEESSDD